MEVLEHKKVRKICSVAAHSTALTVDGELYWWGWNGCSDMQATPKLIEELKDWHILQVVLGAYHILVLATGDAENGNEVFSWGRGTKGQLGHGNTDDLITPKSIELLKTVNVLSLSSGETHSACITRKNISFSFVYFY